MTKLTKVKKGTIKPKKPFTSLTEEAAFWDTHSTVEDIDDGTTVGFHQANKTGVLTIRFKPKDIEKLRIEAHQKGIGPTTLARMWILSQLNP